MHVSKQCQAAECVELGYNSLQAQAKEATKPPDKSILPDLATSLPFLQAQADPAKETTKPPAHIHPAQPGHLLDHLIPYRPAPCACVGVYHAFLSEAVLCNLLKGVALCFFVC